MLVACIYNTLEVSIRRTVPFPDNVKVLWDDLRDRYSQRNGSRIHELKGRIIDSASEYLMLLENEKLHQFLYGLDSTKYKTVVDGLLMMDPLPTLSYAHGKILAAERHNTVVAAQEPRHDAVGFAVDGHASSRFPGQQLGSSREPPICSHCGHKGHPKERCFELIGWPDKYGGRGKGANSRGGRGGGRSGGRGRGNFATAAETGRQQGTASGGDGLRQQGSSSDVDRATLPTLTDAQVQQLVAALNSSKVAPTTPSLHGKQFSDQWIIDTGASNHMSGNVDLFVDLYDISSEPVGLPNGKSTTATKEGRIKLSDSLYLDNVLYVPALNCNLLSVSQLLEKQQFLVLFTNKLCVIQDRSLRNLIGVGEQCNGVYLFRLVRSFQANATVADIAWLWHRRLGHPSMKVVRSLLGVDSSDFNNVCGDNCQVCYMAKQPRDSFPLSNNKATDLFELIHCDIWGPYDVESSNGSHYFLTIVDDYSRATWVYLMVGKYEVRQLIPNFCVMIQTQFNKQVKKLQSDNGQEFVLKDFYSRMGILHQTSCVDTPQQNGRVERKHKHILNVARVLRFQAHLPIKFWGECVLAACHLINRTPTPILNGKTPHEVLFGSPPSFDALKVFGCLCYVAHRPRITDKFGSRSRRCLFVGYPLGKKGWRVYDLDTCEYFVSRDVKFVENVFPFATPTLGPSDTQLDTYFATSPTFIDDDDLDGSHNVLDGAVDSSDANAHMHVPEASTVPAGSTSVEMSPTGPTITTTEHVGRAPVSGTDSCDTSSRGESSFRGSNGVVCVENEPEVLGRGHRTRIPSTRLKGYVTTNTVVRQIDPLTSPSASHTQSCSSGKPFNIACYMDYNKFSVRHRRFLAAITKQKEPTSFKEAVQHPGWRQAMKEEIDALERNGTWTLEDLPPGKRAIGSGWVYKIKYKSNGDVERLKGHLVVFGNRKVEGIDYNETFAPVAKMGTVRIFLAVAVAKNWEVHQMDVCNAFLHGDLEEEVYMQLPPGYSSPIPGKVCRLRKSLYGLRQAPRQWFAKLSEALKRFGFTQSYADYSLFCYQKGDVSLHVVVYVDDLIIAGSSHDVILKFKQYLSTCFHMKDLGVLKYFLGIEVARGDQGLFLSQRKYALDVLQEAGMLGYKPIDTPMEQNHRLAHAKGVSCAHPDQYRRLVGRLVYLSVTRPELSYAVHTLAQFLSNPLIVHWDAAIRVLRYIKGSPGQGILLQPGDMQLNAFCDSDWAACPLTRRSLTGYFFLLGRSPMSWKTKKQATVSRSSAEAEYRAMAVTTCELKWLKALLHSLGVLHSWPMKLFCDSQSALHIAKNPVFHERTKHIEVDCHFVRDELLSGNISTQYVPTGSQLADILTKALGHKQFGLLLRKLGIYNLHAPT
ncbi:Retrovirus-related Pol polyprotein from transposon TNT 1-94 [Bienertia sinuspersici]